MRIHFIPSLLALRLGGCDGKPTQQPVDGNTRKSVAAASSPAGVRGSPDDDTGLRDISGQQTVSFTPARSPRGPYSFSSSVLDTKFIPVDALPVVKRLPVDTAFEHPLTPRTAAGRLAQSRGWAVLGETRMGGLTVIGIARGYKYAAGRFDYLIDGNIAVFDGARLLSVLHRNAADKAGIGFLQPLESGAFRTYTSLPMPPMGDLELSGHRLSYQPLARLDRWCGGRVKIPNIFGQRMTRARAMLAASGWRPRNVKFVGFDGDHEQFVAAGIGEAEYCVQDSIAQCHLHYTAPGARLEVQAGEPAALPESGQIPDGDDLRKTVFFYDVECRVHGRIRR